MLACIVPKLIDHAKRRRQIVDAAWRVVAADGVGELTIRRVAKEAKIVPGSLRYIFATHDDLVAAVADELVARVRAAVAAEAVRHTKPERVALRLLALVPLLPENAQRWRVEHALYVGATQHPRFADAVAACRNIRGVECASVIRQLSEGLQVPGDEIDLEILRALALTEGLSHLSAHAGGSGIAAHEAQIVVRRHVDDVQDNWRRRYSTTAAKPFGSDDGRAQRSRSIGGATAHDCRAGVTVDGMGAELEGGR